MNKIACGTGASCLQTQAPKFEARNPCLRRSGFAQAGEIRMIKIQKLTDSKECHCERSEAISKDCRVAPLLAMTTFFWHSL